MLRKSTRLALTIVVLGCLLAAGRPSSARADTRTGVLLLAHGGAAEWNGAVTTLAAQLDKRAPTETALGMASRATMQAGIDRLIARGVQEIVAVPLFISSHSSVIEATEFLLGRRAQPPPQLEAFARMSHGAAGSHANHDAAAAPEDGTRPVRSSVPIRVTAALDRHRIVGEILTARARAISRDPSTEAVIIVAHGPVTDDENGQWLSDMGVLAAQMHQSIPFARVDALTVRDDAPEPIRSAATAALRETVGRVAGEGRRVLIVPLLLSYGGIEAGIRRRLEGLDYTMADQGLMPDDRIARWVLEVAGL